MLIRTLLIAGAVFFFFVPFFGIAPKTILGIYLVVSFLLVLLWRVWAGMQDYRQFIETTAILKIPIWWAYVPAVASLALLALACLIVLRDCWRDLVRS